MCYLYSKQENYAGIRVILYKSGKIKTYWRKINKYKEQIKNDYTRNKKIMRGLKVNGCAMCGYNKCDAALDFHHVNPEDRKFALGVFSMSKKDERIVEELNKCILLCCRCHREIHEVKYYKVDGE